jgi:hypothetical protein
MTFIHGNTCIIALLVKVHFTLEQATKAHMGSTLGTRWRFTVNAMPHPF